MNDKRTEMPPKTLDNPSLSSFEAELDALKKTQEKTAPRPAGTGDAARAAIDFASASAVGCGLGYGADAYFGSSPWGLLIGLLVGVASGFTMMMRVTMSDIKKSKSQANEQKSGE